MKLRNPFSNDTRFLFFDIGCYECGRRDMRELNHIKGRISASPYNASVLCPECHSHVGHIQEEEQKYLKITKQILKNQDYPPTTKDIEFIEKHAHLYTNTPKSSHQ